MTADPVPIDGGAPPTFVQRAGLILRSGPGGSIAVAATHGIRMVANLVIMKLIAVLLGATGLGFLGNAMSVTSIASVFAGGGISTGVAKYVAEYRSRPLRMVRFIGAATVYGLIFSAALLIVSVIAAVPLAEFLFGSSRYWWLVPVGAAMQCLAFVGMMSVSVSNGLGRTDLFVLVTAPALLVTIPISCALIFFFDLAGGAMALFIGASCTGFTGAVLIARSRLVRLIRLRIDQGDLRRLLGFGTMLAASAISVPVGEILIRSHIAEVMGHHQAGLWQAVIRLSAAYLGFFNVVLATRYMPSLSALTGPDAICQKVVGTLWRVAGLFCVFGLAIFVFRGLIITLLFSREFLPLAEFMAFQIIGDGFRVCAYVVGFLAAAKGATRLYITGEAVQMGLWVGCAFIAIDRGGDLLSVSVGYMAAYILYFVVVSACALFQWRRLR